MDKKSPSSKHHQTSPSTRREFLRKSALAGGTAVAAAAWGYLSHNQDPVYHFPEKIYSLKGFRDHADLPFKGLVAVRGDNVPDMVAAALKPFGGMERFIRPGDRVVVKPNIAWDRTPEQAANTNPEVVAAVVRHCIAAGAGRVIVTDVSCNDAYRCFSRSGIEQAALAAGGEILFPREELFLPADLKGGVLKVWPVFKPFLEADRVINLPVVKHHSLSRCTLAMKNWYGILGGRRNQLHQDIHPSIVDLAAAMRPTLTLVDATRVLFRNGPTGGNVADVKPLRTLLAGVDEVALDTLAAGLLDLGVDDVPYLKMAEARGIGSTDIQNFRMEKISL